MEVIPAIDLMGGRCVQLVGGDPETKKDYGDPVEKALDWKAKGASMLHVVDLDAALGRGGNLNVLTRLKKDVGLPVEFGGGVRSLDRVRELLRLNIDRVIVGTMAVKDYTEGFKALKTVTEEFGERVIVAVDSRGGYVTVKGWTEKTSLEAVELVKAAREHAWGFLYTDVDVEGRMGGVNIDQVKKVVEASDKPVIVSGGISSAEDVEACRDSGAWGVVLGKALYENRLNLEDVV